MPNLNWHDYLVFISSIASIAGLVLIAHTHENLESDERGLLLTIFTYWLVYCVAFGILKLNLTESDILLLSLKLTAGISYLLTFACVLTLPMSRFASKYVE